MIYWICGTNYRNEAHLGQLLKKLDIRDIVTVHRTGPTVQKDGIC